MQTADILKLHISYPNGQLTLTDSVNLSLNLLHDPMPHVNKVITHLVRDACFSQLRQRTLSQLALPLAKSTSNRTQTTKDTERICTTFLYVSTSTPPLPISPTKGAPAHMRPTTNSKAYFSPLSPDQSALETGSQQPTSSPATSANVSNAMELGKPQ